MYKNMYKIVNSGIYIYIGKFPRIQKIIKNSIHRKGKIVFSFFFKNNWSQTLTPSIFYFSPKLFHFMSFLFTLSWSNVLKDSFKRAYGPFTKKRFEINVGDY